jgi:hypothetical protein
MTLKLGATRHEVGDKKCISGYMVRAALAREYQ